MIHGPANQESGGGAQRFESGPGFSGNRNQDCQGDPWAEGHEESGPLKFAIPNGKSSPNQRIFQGASC